MIGVTKASRFLIVAQSQSSDAMTVELSMQLVDDERGGLSYVQRLSVPAGAVVSSVFAPGFNGMLLRITAQVVAGEDVSTVVSPPLATVEVRHLLGDGDIRNAWSQVVMAGCVTLSSVLGYPPMQEQPPVSNVWEGRNVVGASLTVTLARQAWTIIDGIYIQLNTSATVASRRPKIEIASASGILVKTYLRDLIPANATAFSQPSGAGPATAVTGLDGSMLAMADLSLPIYCPPGSTIEHGGDNYQANDTLTLVVTGRVVAAMEYPGV